MRPTPGRPSRSRQVAPAAPARGPTDRDRHEPPKRLGLGRSRRGNKVGRVIVCVSNMYGYRACPDCGTAVQRARLEANAHDCVPERFVSYQALKARRGLDRLEDDLAWWLTTPQGGFQAFLARRSSR